MLKSTVPFDSSHRTAQLAGEVLRLLQVYIHVAAAGSDRASSRSNRIPEAMRLVEGHHRAELDPFEGDAAS